MVIVAKEMTEAELIMPFCCEYTQKLFDETQIHMGGKWLMMGVADADVLEDPKKLITLRVRPK